MIIVIIMKTSLIKWLRIIFKLNIVWYSLCRALWSSFGILRKVVRGYVTSNLDHFSNSEYFRYRFRRLLHRLNRQLYILIQKLLWTGTIQASRKKIWQCHIWKQRLWSNIWWRTRHLHRQLCRLQHKFLQQLGSYVRPTGGLQIWL